MTGYNLSRIGASAAVRIATLAACVAAMACGRDDAQQTTTGRPGATPAVVPIEIAQAELGTAARFIEATGTVEPLRTIGINGQLSGALLQVLVQEGDRVRQGTVLARIDSRELEAQLASAEASLTVAKSAAERSQQLHEQRIVTVAEYERDQAAYTAARATRDQLKTRLGYSVVRSPIDGVVLNKRVEAGDIVSPQARLFTIGEVSTLVVRVPISELDVTGLRAGDTVAVGLDALPGQVLDGRIRRIFPSADTLTRLVPVEVALSGATARRVRPGFLARVRFQLDPRTGVIMVPAAALVDDNSGSAVFLVNGEHVSRRSVQRGGTFQGRVEIVQGLVPGDTVAVAGNNLLRDGSEVRVVLAPAPAPDGPAAAPLRGATSTADGVAAAADVR